MSEDYVVKSAFPQVVQVDAHNFKIHMATDRGPIILSIQRHTAKHIASEIDFYPLKPALKEVKLRAAAAQRKRELGS